MKIALDHHYSPAIAERLRHLGLDAVAVVERGWHAEDDESLLALCADEGRTLVTNNVADFAAIVRRWHAEGRRHRGVLYTSNSSLPRTKDTIGVYVAALETLMIQFPGADDFVDLTQWLRRPEP